MKVLPIKGLPVVVGLLLFSGVGLVSCFSSPPAPPPLVNHPPRIISLTAERQEVPVTRATKVSCLATDADGDVLSYNWSTNGGRIEGGGSEVVWVAPEAPATYTVTVTVSDGNGGKASQSLNLTAFVRPNNPPRIVGVTVDGAPPRDVNSSRAYITHTIKCVAEDPDEDTLQYTWTATDGKLTGAGSEVSWTAPGLTDEYTVTVVVSDGRGGTATAQVRFSVSCCGK